MNPAPMVARAASPRPAGGMDTPGTGASADERVVHGRFDTTQRFPTRPTTEKVDC